MTREKLKGIVFKTHSPLTVEEVMFCIDRYVEQVRADAIEEFAERVSKTDINTSNSPMNQVTLIKMQMLKEQNK